MLIYTLTRSIKTCIDFNYQKAIIYSIVILTEEKKEGMPDKRLTGQYNKEN